jgi:hypothetical protein
MVSFYRSNFSVCLKNNFSVSVYDTYDPDVDDKFTVNKVYIRVYSKASEKYVKFSNDDKFEIKDPIDIGKIMIIAGEAIDFDDCQQKINLFRK